MLCMSELAVVLRSAQAIPFEKEKQEIRWID